MAVKVLIVDNAPYARARLRNLLEKHSYEVVGEAGDTREAVSQFRKCRPDIVTVDLILEGDHGLRTIDALRKVDPNVRCIVVTAVRDQASIDLSHIHGAIAFVNKTDDWMQLEMALKKAVQP